MLSSIYSILSSLPGGIWGLIKMVYGVLPGSVDGFILGIIIGGVGGALIYRNNANIAQAKLQQISDAIAQLEKMETAASNLTKKA